MAEKVHGLVLKSAGSSEPQSIPGLPGLWSTVPEMSVVPSDLGMELLDLMALAEEFGVEVEKAEWEREVEIDGRELTVGEVKARAADLTDIELGTLAKDSRKGVRDAAKAEVKRRGEAGGGGLIGQVGGEVGGSGGDVGGSGLSPLSSGTTLPGATPPPPLDTTGTP